MIELVDDGLIVELDDAQASANASYVNEQGLLATNPKLEKEFSVDNLVGFVGRTGWNAKEYPFPFVRSSDTLEPTREGLFEKVKFYSTFLNKEERANYLWGQLQTRLDCVQANAAAIELEKGEMTKILWAGYSGYCKGWDVARTGPFYYHDFAKVCSADLLHAEMGGDMISEVERCQSPERKYMSPEDFHEFGKDADVWLWNGPSPPPLDDASIFTEEVKAFKAFQNQEFYFPGGSTGWFDQANIQPDVLIEDICSIAGTLDLEDGSEYQRKWYSNAFTLDVNTPNPTCEELGGIDAPRETLGSNCAFRTADARGDNLLGCIDPAEFDPEKDYFPHKAIVEVAELFSIDYHGHYKIVRNTEDDKTYVLVQCGAPAPSAEELAAIGITDVDFTIDVPLTNVALQYSTMEAFFGMLGERRKVQAILGTSYSTESCMMELVDNGLIVELDDAQASTNASYVNEQGLLATNPKLEKEFSVDNLVGFVGRTGWNAKEYPFPLSGAPTPWSRRE